ncbi:MAG: 16S rRNA (guanine(527)-N(7))-methyltransferase RsmG [Planctomycetota bacterium]
MTPADESPTVDDSEDDLDALADELEDAAGGDEEGDGDEDGGDGKTAAERKAEEDEKPDPALAAIPLPSLDELTEAMEWAFSNEEVLPGVLERYAEHALCVLEGNRELNLTAIVDPKEVAVKHYLDSWRATRLLPLMGRSVLDLGCGAGFPGMPTALCEDMTKVTLLDARRKKADFVAKTIERMGVKNAKAEWGRGEEYLVKARHDVVFMRALSSVRENVRLLRKVRHSIHDVVMFKGPSWSREVRAAEREAERLGFQLDTVWEHELPGEMGGRAILIYRAPGAR